MMPASQPATNRPPKRGTTATTSPAAISTTPTTCIASDALPGRMSLNWVDRYRVQSSVSTPANLSSPNRIGATVKAIRSSRSAWAAGSSRSVRADGSGTGRRAPATALLMGSPRGGFESDQVEQALGLLAAGRAAGEVSAHAGDPSERRAASHARESAAVAGDGAKSTITPFGVQAGAVLTCLRYADAGSGGGGQRVHRAHRGARRGRAGVGRLGPGAGARRGAPARRRARARSAAGCAGRG